MYPEHDRALFSVIDPRRPDVQTQTVFTGIAPVVVKDELTFIGNRGRRGFQRTDGAPGHGTAYPFPGLCFLRELKTFSLRLGYALPGEDAVVDEASYFSGFGVNDSAFFAGD